MMSRNLPTSTKKSLLKAGLPLMMLAILLPVTIFAVLQQTEVRGRAEETAYVSKAGSGEEGIFSVSDPEVTEKTSTKVTIVWTTNGDARGTVSYWPDSILHRIFPFLPDVKATEHDFTTAHNLVLTEGIVGGRTYNYTISSHTPAGETYPAKKMYSFTTPR